MREIVVDLVATAIVTFLLLVVLFAVDDPTQYSRTTGNSAKKDGNNEPDRKPGDHGSRDSTDNHPTIIRRSTDDQPPFDR
jgi:hypothetical protein